MGSIVDGRRTVVKKPYKITMCSLLSLLSSFRNLLSEKKSHCLSTLSLFPPYHTFNCALKPTNTAQNTIPLAEQKIMADESNTSLWDMN